MIVQQLGLTKRNILCKIELNSFPEESRYLKIPRNKPIFSGFSCHFGFYLLNFCSKENLMDSETNFTYLVSLTQIKSQNFPRKSTQILRHFPVLQSFGAKKTFSNSFEKLEDTAPALQIYGNSTFHH